MPEPMKTTDVPKDLAAVAAALLRDWPKSGVGNELFGRRILAAVLPLHARQVRQAIAAEVEAHAASIGWYEGGGVWTEALDVVRCEPWMRPEATDA